jgi:hypothetical protein
MYEKEDINPSEARSIYILSDLCHIGDGRYKVLKGPLNIGATVS